MGIRLSSRVPILHRYVLREVAGPFLISLFVLTSVLFLARLLKLVDLVVNKNVPLGDTVLLFSYVIPGFLEFALPMAVLVGVLLAFGRLSQDSELVVIRATGMSLTQLALPVFFFALLAALLSMSMAFWVRPWANYKLDMGLFEIVKLRAGAGISPGVFAEFGPLTIYSERVDDDTGRLSNVIIADRRDPELNRNFIAKHGQMISDPATRAISLQLYDGIIQEGAGLNFTVTSFEINSIKLPQSDLIDDNAAKTGKRANEMSISELMTAIDSIDLSATSSDSSPLAEATSAAEAVPEKAVTEKSDTEKSDTEKSGTEKSETEKAATGQELVPRKDPKLQRARYLVEYHRRLTIPISCLCVALAALALGIQPVRASRAVGAAGNIMLGLALILIYYLLMAVVSAVGSQGKAPPVLLMWIPNILFFGLGAFWFRQIGTERWTAVSQALLESFSGLSKRIGFGEARRNQGGER